MKMEKRRTKQQMKELTMMVHHYYVQCGMPTFLVAGMLDISPSQVSKIVTKNGYRDLEKEWIGQKN